MDSRSPFAGGDQRYLRDEQYGDPTRLGTRSTLHQRFSTAPSPLVHVVAALIDWAGVGRAIDVGAGAGGFWDNPSTPRSVALTLTDLSPGMVDASTARARSLGYRTVTGRECDAQALPYPDASFDVAVANHMLYHVPDPDRAVAELARVLRPDGVLLATTNGRGHMDQVNEAIAEVFDDHHEGLADVFGLDSGERRLRRAFASVVWHAYDNDLLVTDLDAVDAYARSFPPGESATAAQAEALRRALQRRFVDGRMRIRTRTGAFVCRRPRVDTTMTGWEMAE